MSKKEVDIILPRAPANSVLTLYVPGKKNQIELCPVKGQTEMCPVKRSN